LAHAVLLSASDKNHPTASWNLQRAAFQPRSKQVILCQSEMFGNSDSKWDNELRPFESPE
jgi:hypothetical protein